MNCGAGWLAWLAGVKNDQLVVETISIKPQAPVNTD